MILFQVATGDLHCFGPNHGGPTHVFGSPSDGAATVSVMVCSAAPAERRAGAPWAVARTAARRKVANAIMVGSTGLVVGSG